MTLDEFANKYNMHDSLINAITYENNTLQIDIDFAFWMQDWFIDGSSETGSLKVTFCNTSSYQHPDSLPLEDISILETSVIDDTITFALINDMTDEYLELVITASEVIVE